METEAKVFHSEISRVDCEEESHLYDILKIEPATPVLQRQLCSKNEAWEFQPKEKHFSPKRIQSKLKVKTVSDVRALFEKDVYSYLLNDLELQQSYLLRKICDGSSNENKTKKIATSLLNGDVPISRSSWQMLSNINPEKHKHTKQFVLWNGRCIQVNGSKGGKTKFICHHDLKIKFRKSLNNISHLKKSLFKSRISLLRNSLTVKFRPGPLTKKKFLDASHHKYHMGDIELVKLPGPVLEVSPAYGTILEPTIASYVNGLRGEEGVIPQKLAEFAVSVLGKVHNNTVMQHDENCSISFDLSYKCEQNRILMRRNVLATTPYLDNNNSNKIIETETVHGPQDGSYTNLHVNFREVERCASATDSEGSFIEIKQIMSEMLDSVYISLNQDKMYSKENEFRDTTADDGKELAPSKDKNKRKNLELDKLDVTIIKLSESSKKDYTKPCDKSFCGMGCVCESLDSTFSLKQHCGSLDCMFGCKCEISKYKDIEFLEKGYSDLVPGLLSLDNELNSHMAKEEQKFHQTIIFAGEKSIILKPRKRNCKSSKRYEEFYSKLNLKSDEKIKKVLTVDIEKLNCENIEPLCMVHNLYKCFCKLKFTDTYLRNDNLTNNNKSLNDEINQVQIEMTANKLLDNDYAKLDSDGSAKLLRFRPRKTYENARSDFRNYSSNTDDDDELSLSCARTTGYQGRKYSDGYYLTTNKKIQEMEQNDSVLKKKMMRLINGQNILSTPGTMDTRSEFIDCDTVTNDNGEIEYDNRLSSINYNKIVYGPEEINKDISTKTTNKSHIWKNNNDSKSSLTKWLETSYKSYKERLGKGVIKNSLEPPQKGKAALQRWDFILSRYRERKNIFVVSKQEPFRTFLAVDSKHPFIANCINIDDIRFADLPKYPIIVQNLVTNATESENVFCILRGWDHYWELIGAAVKVIEQATGSLTQDVDFLNTYNLMAKHYSSDDANGECDDTSCEFEGVKEKGCSEVPQAASEKSKWFVLTVEDDFTELQFYKKGFYVTYDRIQRSISLARILGKTIRLSSRAHMVETQSSAQPYGIYAIPYTVQCCVFIGPYEEQEPLGIEVVKSVLHSRKVKKTRGVWIITNKFDNKNVIDNPLAYLPSTSTQNENIPIVNADINRIPAVVKDGLEGNLNNETPENEIPIPKQIKPIKIRRTNGFYHLSSQNILQKIAKPDLFVNSAKESLLKSVNITEPNPSVSNLQPIKKITLQKKMDIFRPSTSSATCIKPVAEVTPQIKITNVYSEKVLPDKTTDIKSSMLILKPEEINKKASQNPVVSEELATDIEKFLEASTICIAPQDEILEISDGEEDMVTPTDIWIQCTSVENFGYIPAKLSAIKSDNRVISFEFPGFNYSEFYQENEAFDKINQILARKIYIPKNMTLKWQIIREQQHLTCDKLTIKCLEDKKYLLTKLRQQQEKKCGLVKAFTMTTPKKKSKETSVTTPKESFSRETRRTYINKKTASPDRDVNIKAKEIDTPGPKSKQMKLIEGLEETSRKLERQGAVLWNEAITKRDEILGSLSVPDNMKLDLTEALEDIMLLNKE